MGVNILERIIRVHVDGKTVVLKAQKGINLLDYLQDNSFDISSPCGGNGKCGKCRIKVRGIKTGASENEKRLLGEEAFDKGYRLACLVDIESDLDVYIDSNMVKASIVAAGKARAVKLEPAVTKEHIKLKPPSLESQSSDLERIEEAASARCDYSLEFLRGLTGILKEKDYDITLVKHEDTVMAVEPGDTEDSIYGIAVDIGTTTIAAYLYDLNTGERKGVDSALNPQKAFGADVISRIDYATESAENEARMHERVVKAVNELAVELCKSCDVKKDRIYLAVFAGNTTMMHFLTRLPSGGIAVSPFIPVTTEMHSFYARDLGVNINMHARATILPCVAGYIGADTVAAVLSSGMYSVKENSLLIDIGTNGEIVYGGIDGLYACSTAAGPAFEGANIRHGTAGISGAVDTVSYKGRLVYTTIDNIEPAGICGSGLVDAVAVLLEQGVIDETGRIMAPEECERLPDDLMDRIIEIDGAAAFRIADRKDKEDIILTQRDIRELQNAKAAIAAGIATLVRRAGKGFEDIKKIYLAGGFGSHLNVDSAVKIGLIPVQLKSKVESIGNAAGEGAVETLLSRQMMKQAVHIKGKMEYIELSGSPEFVNEYINCMLFDENYRLSRTTDA